MLLINFSLEQFKQARQVSESLNEVWLTSPKTEQSELKKLLYPGLGWSDNEGSREATQNQALLFSMKNLDGVKLKILDWGGFGVGGERCWRNSQCRRDCRCGCPDLASGREVFTLSLPLHSCGTVAARKSQGGGLPSGETSPPHNHSLLWVDVPKYSSCKAVNTKALCPNSRQFWCALPERCRASPLRVLIKNVSWITSQTTFLFRLSASFLSCHWLQNQFYCILCLEFSP